MLTKTLQECTQSEHYFDISSTMNKKFIRVQIFMLHTKFLCLGKSRGDSFPIERQSAAAILGVDEPTCGKFS